MALALILQAIGLGVSLAFQRIDLLYPHPV